MRIIEPIVFEKPIEYPYPDVDSMCIQKVKIPEETPAMVSVSKNSNIVDMIPIDKNKNININIDSNNKERPFGLKLDLIVADVEIYPKVPKILEFLGNLF